MINLQFFPSRRLALYTVKLFVTRSLAVLVALILVLMTLDLLGESGKILAVPGNSEAQLWQYVSLRLPLLISRFLPFAVLLGTLDRLHRAQPAQRSRRDEGGGRLRAPDAGAADRGQPRHRGPAVRFQRDGSSSTRTGTSPPGATTITVPSRPKAASCRNVWLLHGDDLIQAGHAGGQGRGIPRRAAQDLRPRRRQPEPRHPGRSRRAAEWRMEARECPDLRFLDERRSPSARNDGAGGRRAEPVDACQGRSRPARFLDAQGAHCAARGGRPAVG